MGDFKPFRGAGCSLAAFDVEMIICHLFPTTIPSILDRPMSLLATRTCGDGRKVDGSFPRGVG